MNKKIFLMPLLVLVGLLCFTACSDDDTPKGDPYLNFDGITGTINVDENGFTQDQRKSVIIRSNRAWKVTYENEADASWLHTFIDEGEDDGHIQYWVDANPAFASREGKVNFVDEQGKVLNTLDVFQAASTPNITLSNASLGYTVLPAASTLDIAVNHNIPFTATLSASDWAKIDSVGDNAIHLSFLRNAGAARSVTLTLTGTGEHSNITSSTVITQASPGIVLNEDFSWLDEGEEASFDHYPEVRFDKWTDDEKSHGWSTISSYMYGGKGYIKLGKTNNAGDAVSPAFTELKETSNVVVNFKAIGYIATTGKKDDAVLKVAVIGPGEVTGENMSTIEVDGTTYKCVRFELESFPEVGKMRSEYDPFAQPNAQFSLHINGATSETQLLFVGGEVWNTALKGTGQGKNRCMIDDVNVRISE